MAVEQLATRKRTSEREAEGGTEPLCTADPRRFSVLAVFVLSASMAAVSAGRGLAPVYALAETRFGYGTGHINALAYSYSLWYCPGSLFALWVIERYGLRLSILAGFSAQLCATVLASVGCRLASPHAAYWMLYTASLIASTTQPLFVNNTTRLASDWFPSAERDRVVLACSVGRSLGVMAISLSAPWVVSTPSQVGELYDWQLAVWPLLLLAATAVLTDRPDQPPSTVALQQWKADDEARAVPLPEGDSRGWRAVRTTWTNAGRLCSRPNFVALATSYSLITGMGWALMTVVGQLLEPCGYSTFAAGAANAALMGANVVGTLLTSPFVNKGTYLPFQRMFSWAMLGATVAVLATARAGMSLLWIIISWALAGAFLGPLMPVTYVHASEMTLPLPAQYSSAVLVVGSNLVQSIETAIITVLLKLPMSTSCSSAVTPAASFTLAAMLAGIVCVHLIGLVDGGQLERTPLLPVEQAPAEPLQS
jgi:MFS family permease